jgi:hypothetical protein
MSLRGVKERMGPWYAIEYGVRNRATGDTVALGRADWADWALDGDLLVAKGGCLLRLRRGDGGVEPLEAATCIVDLNDRFFTPRESPALARTWFTDLAV